MYGTILLAVDDTRRAGRAVDKTRALAHALGDKVVVVHVREYARPARVGRFTDDPLDEATAFVEPVVELVAAAGVQVTSDLRTCEIGKVGPALIAAALEHGAGLIAIGSQAAGEFRAMTMGSVAHDVVRLAQCPVLVVPEQSLPHRDN